MILVFSGQLTVRVVISVYIYIYVYGEPGYTRDPNLDHNYPAKY